MTQSVIIDDDDETVTFTDSVLYRLIYYLNTLPLKAENDDVMNAVILKCGSEISQLLIVKFGTKGQMVVLISSVTSKLKTKQP